MEFDKSINSVLRDVITKVDNRLQVCRSAGIGYQDARLQLFDIVNKMGEASARAQGLAGAITTGRRLETSDHHLYIMKDTEGSSGQGAVIGILKIGRKRLFVYDRHGQQWEMNPLCVLDFYVHESRQRMGCGRRLFDFMLKEENMAPQHMAVDRPSVKFSSFLAKHYGLRTEIPQVNNFVIFEGFFTQRPDGDFIHNRRSANLAKPADYPSRGAVENYNNSGAQLYNYSHTNTSLPGHSARPPSGPHTKTVPAGLPSVLPRHQIHGYHQDNPLKDLNLNPRPAQTLAGSGSCTPGGLSEVELRSVSAGSSGKRKGGATNLPLQATMYSRHQTQDSFNPPHYTTAHRPPTGNKNTTSALANNVRQRPPSGSNNATADFRQQPPSGNKNATARRENSPPMLRREGPPRDYLQSLNLHHNYQGRAGHLLVTSDPKVGGTQTSAAATATTPSVSQPEKCMPSLNTGQSSSNSGHSAQSFRGGYYTNPALHTNADTSWTVFGALRKQDYYSARHSGRTRLW